MESDVKYLAQNSFKYKKVRTKILLKAPIDSAVNYIIIIRILGRMDLMKLTTAEFSEKFRIIREMGYVASLRSGPTGVGYTLETLLGINENNDALPDIEGAELKAHRENSSNLITLFTFNNKAWRIPPLEAIKKYGSLDRNGRQGLYYTISLKPNNAGLFLFVEKNSISVRHILGATVVEWSLEDLANRFIQKLPSLILVTASAELRDDKEYFKFKRARLMKNTTPELLRNQFEAENVLVDLRLHDKGTRARNHGTGFRAHEDKLSELFKLVLDL